MEKLNEYENGNYTVTIYNDGTKVRENNLDFFNAEFPENIDLKITNYCPMGCPMCHEGSNVDGKHSDLLNAKFIDTLTPGTELAIGGGMATSHPDLIPFLERLKVRGIIPNITVHQNELNGKIDLLSKMIEEKLVYGVGISFHHKNDEFWDSISKNPNVVVHLINGIHGKDVFDYLANRGLKILILGYKVLRRGQALYETNKDEIESKKQWLYDNLESYLSKFKVISFDNLSIRQLEPHRFLTQDEWDEFYMGDDGQFTMYIDLVEKQFAMSSTTINRHVLLDNIEDMFKVVKNESK